MFSRKAAAAIMDLNAKSINKRRGVALVPDRRYGNKFEIRKKPEY